MDDETFADMFVGESPAVASEPIAAPPPATSSVAGTQSPVAVAEPIESGTAPALPEAEPLTPEAKSQQLEAQLAAITEERNRLASSVSQEQAQKDAATAAAERAKLQTLLNRENGIAKQLHKDFLEEGEKEKAAAFAWLHDSISQRSREAQETVARQQNAILAYVYVTQVLAPTVYANIIEIADSVEQLSGEEMVAAVNSIVDQQLNAREGDLGKDKTIEDLKSEIATLRAQSTDPRAHLVEGGPSQPGQKPESEWTFEDHWNHARGAPVGVGAS